MEYFVLVEVVIKNRNSLVLKGETGANVDI